MLHVLVEYWWFRGAKILMGNGHFNLFQNAFWVLKAEYESTHAEIVELVEDAEFDEVHPQDLILRSQQVLLSPIARLNQELGWLPGLSARQISETRTLLNANHTEELAKTISFFPDLPKANVLAHLCVIARADGSRIQNLIRCWDNVDRTDLLEFINSQRQISGFPKVDSAQLGTAVSALEAAHANNAAMAIWRLEEPGKVMEQLIEEELENGPLNAMLAHFVREYDNLSVPKLSKISSEIDHQVRLAREAAPDLDRVTNEIADLLRRWDDVNQPVQVYEQSQGHEEGRSKKIYETLRSLCLELANDRGEFQYARLLSEALLHTFPELESVAEVLKGDVAALESLDEQQKQFTIVEPLVAACESAKSQLPKLKAALQNFGFTQAHHGILKDIYDTFDAAAKAPASKDAAFFVIRNLALFVNNDRNDPETAFRLIDGLIAFRHATPSKEVRTKLEEERAVLHRNWKMGEFKNQAGNLGAMSKTIDEMLKYAKGNDRAELWQLKSAIDRKQMGKKVKWLIYGGIAVVIGFFVISEKMSKPTSRSFYQSSPSRLSTNSPSITNFEEKRPPVGQGLVLNRSQVRYCVFQGERLEAMRSMTSTAYQISRLNELIGDYNSRCSNYQYHSGVLSSIRLEATSKSNEFTADARRILASW